MANRKKLYRCRTENSVRCDDPEFGRVFGAGQVVDFAEQLGKNKAGAEVTLGEIVRVAAFEKYEPETKTIRVSKMMIPVDVPLEAEAETKKNEGD